MNRHDLISHFYSEYFLNEQGKGVLEVLKFASYSEAMQWIANEFTKVKLDWHTLDAGSPYPRALPIVVKNIEEGANISLEDAINAKWANLSEDEKAIANDIFKKIFGFPELAQGKNKPYCNQKYKNWLVLRDH